MIMDRDEAGSRVTQSLDSLWFYTNVLAFTHRHSVASLTPHHFSPNSTASTHANGSSHKRDLQKPNSPTLFSLRNDQQQHEFHSQHSENLTPRCDRCGEISAALEIPGAGGDTSEILVKRGSGSRETKKKREHRRKSKGWNKSGGVNNGRGEVISFSALPPLDDDVAMKQHLKSWAYAVACILK